VVNYNQMMLTLKPQGLAVRLRGKMVEVYDFPDGRLEVRWKGRSLRARRSTSYSGLVMPPSSKTSASARFSLGSRSSRIHSHVSAASRRDHGAPIRRPV